jgi:hypothetical protein
MAMRDCPDCGVRLWLTEQFFPRVGGWRRVKACSNCTWSQPIGPVYPTAEAARTAPYRGAPAETAAAGVEWR